MLLKTTRVAVCVVICVASGVGLLAAQTPQSPVEFVVQRNSAPQWTAQEKARGFVVCTDHWMRPMFDVFVPTREQIVTELSCALARDEYESLQVGVHALEDLGPVKMTVELDLPVQAYRFLYLDRELTVATSPGEGQRLLQKQPVKMPYYLFPRAEHKQVDNGKTVGFWLTIQAPAQAAPGVHSGVVRITANGQEVEVPLQVTVRDFVLPRPDIAFGMYFDLQSRINKNYQGPQYERMYYEDMAAHGMNSVSIYDDAHLLWDEEGQFNEPRMVEKFNMMTEAGLLDGTQPVMFLSGYWGSEKLRPKAAQILGELRGLQQRHGWPHILLYGHDEPGGPFAPKIEEMQPWVQADWEFVTAMHAPEAIEALAPYYAVIEVNARNISRHTKDLVEKAGTEFWTYECCAHGFSPAYARCYPGLFSWNAGVKGNYVWAYTHAQGDDRDHYTVEPDGTVTINNGRWYSRAIPGADGPIPTIGWEAQREGVDDYRYLQLLRDSAAAPDADPALVSEVNQWFEALKYLVRWYDLSGRHHVLVPENNDFDMMDFFDPYPQVTPQRYDQVRTEAADFVMRLGEGEG